MQDPIGIIGAGLGGLVLGRILEQHHIPVVVFESDSSAASRRQGGLLDIHSHNGQIALRQAGLFDGFEALLRPGEDAKRIVDQYGNVLLEVESGALGSRPEVERGALRDMLISAISPNTIQWGHRLTALSERDQGYELSFANGAAMRCSMIVGADGAWSKVRPYLSGAVPIYSGVSFLETWVDDAGSRFPEAMELLGKGTLMALGAGKAIFAHVHDTGDNQSQVQLYLALKTAIDALSGENALALIAGQFDGWAQPLRQLIDSSDREPILRPIYALPTEHQWHTKRGLTLIGDAAHLMSPFAGEGANLAMLDGAQLGQAIVSHGGDMVAAIADYEREMVTRSAQAALQSQANLQQFFEEDTPTRVVALFKQMQGNG